MLQYGKNGAKPLLFLFTLLLIPLAQAHHSFAVHFVAEGTTEVKGVVESFRRRRGWSRDSLKPGDEITVLGFPARDGTSYMRISKVTFADGHELIGQAAPPPPGEAD